MVYLMPIKKPGHAPGKDSTLRNYTLQRVGLVQLGQGLATQVSQFG
jgi:hypothetical protein